MEIGPKAVRSRIGLPILPGEGPPRDAAARRDGPATYYDIPFLKPPTWHWQIAAYFFLEGVSSGSFLIASLADLTGRESYRSLVRAGYYISFASFLPCPPLLIADLGRPERFHHMLRIFKPTSPMSHGSWALAAYGLPMGLLTAEQALADLPGLSPRARRLARLVPTGPLGTLGIPCALVLATYPGVLLSTTSNPLWSRSRLLGALFACSSVHSGASAVSLALALAGDEGEASERVARIERIATLAEGAALAGFLAAAGRNRRHLVSGPGRRLFALGAVGAGLALPALVKAIAPKRGRGGRLARVVASALALAGAFALKWAVTKAGKLAAADARGSHEAAAARTPSEGWSPEGRMLSEGERR